MIKQVLLAGAAVAALSATPAFAQETSVITEVSYDNTIATSLITGSNTNRLIGIEGTVTIEGDVEIDSSATAISDTKQVIDGDQVILHADQDGDGIIDQDVNGDGVIDDGEGERARSSNFAAGADVDADGNVGANVAAGHYNQQSNVTTIAVSTDTPATEAGQVAGGWSEASTTSLQSLSDTYYGADQTDETLDPSTTVNGANGGVIAGSGNIGSNTASGAFNQQQNVMTLAVAADSALAGATAGVVQYSTNNMVAIYENTNFVDGGAVTGTGNVGANIAAGVGNQQHNSLTVAASGAFGGNGTGGAGAGGLDTGTGGTGGTGGTAN